MVGCESNTELHTSEPAVQFDRWEHVSEGPLEMKTSDLVILNCMGQSANHFDVEPGLYRVRCCHANLAGGVDSGEGTDWYCIQIWPAPLRPLVEVLKRAPRR